MKTTQFLLIFLFMISPALALTAPGKIPLKAMPNEVFAGSTVAVLPDSGKTYLYEAPILFTAEFDGKPIALTSITKYSVTFVVPMSSTFGEHTISVAVNDGPYGEAKLTVKKRSSSQDTIANGSEKDPKKQYGDPIDAGKDPIGRERGGEVINPSGGYGNTPIVPCDSLHRIDGKFTDSVVGIRKEWSGIIPQTGRFSNLYLDYCDKTRTLYLMNDWYLATEQPDSSSCYNLFVFYTGGGAESWEIRVYHNLAKGTKVIRNGVDVSKDTNYVIGGQYGFNPSPMFPQPHTMYEFGIRTLPGNFFLPTLCDPVRPVGPKTICDESGYGLITDPTYFYGELGNNGVSIRQDSRYIPLSGVAGLTIDPIVFGGNLGSTSSTIRSMGNPASTVQCNGQHEIDGAFSTFANGYVEWSKTPYAKGKYSNLYAEYCNGTLYILNDWVLGIEEPDKMNCYNLFELFTAGGKEHWGIYVYHSISKGIRVFLNGKDVSSDSNIVKGGKFGFDVSPIMPDKKHTIYEFGVKASEGSWHLFLADPGPSSFCDGSNESIPRISNLTIGAKIPGANSFQSNIQASYFDTTHIAFATTQNAGEWGGNRFRATLKYDPTLFYPLQAVRGSGQNVASVFKKMTSKITQPGVFQIDAEVDNGFTSSGDLFVLSGIPLAGRDSISEISGIVELGNSAVYMRSTAIQPIRISAYSKNPVTRGLVFGNNSAILSATVSPNPLNCSDRLTLSFTLNQEAVVRIQIIDVLGNVIYSAPESKYSAGEQNIGINAGFKQIGTYCMRISTTCETVGIPFIIKE